MSLMSLMSLSLSLSWPPAPPWWGGAGAGIIIPTGIIILGVRSSWTPPTAEARHQTTPWAGLMGRGWKGAGALPARIIHANHNIVCMYGFDCERAYMHYISSHIKRFSCWNSESSYWWHALNKHSFEIWEIINAISKENQRSALFFSWKGAVQS